MELILSHDRTDKHHAYYDCLFKESPVRVRQILKNGDIEILYSDVAKAMGYADFGDFILNHPGAIETVSDLREAIINELPNTNQHATRSNLQGVC